MARIRILSDQVANQIAAGEVIERPVAVVKELVENSLDAGATAVEVEFRQGGKSYIRVEDNGGGMEPDDALLALERHATSKIQAADDLLRIRTFGFRGEALPSIASVSRFLLCTRPPGAEAGTEILVDGGKLVYQKACGMPPGTRIEVSQLFKTVPARRKFLKTDATESAHIVQTLRLLATANPDCGFTLLENGRMVFRSPASPDLRVRVAEIWRETGGEELLDLEVAGVGLSLHGLIGPPSLTRGSRHELVTLVNRRQVDSRTLSYAVMEAYHTCLPKGRYPVAFLFLEIDPAAVDVNVHPAKREVRFRDEGKVRNFVLTAVLERLRHWQEALRGPARPESPARGGGAGQAHPRAPDPFDLSAARPASPRVETPVRPAVPAWPEGQPGPAREAIHEGRASAEPAPTEAPGADKAEPRRAVEKEAFPGGDLPAASPSRWPLIPGPEPERPPFQPVTPVPRAPAAVLAAERARLNWRFLGRMVTGWVLFETGQGIVLLDPAAARARVQYESIREQFQADRAAGQQLLLPLALDLDPISSALLEESLPFLHRRGFQLEPFGRHFFRVTALPPWLDPGRGEIFLRDLLAQVRQRGFRLDEADPDPAHEAMARLALGAAAGIDRDPEGATGWVLLAERLMSCRDPLTDPAGRPTLVELSRREIERRFGR